jgi:hypothetical protein
MQRLAPIPVMTTPRRVAIIEPRLQGPTGHYLELTRSIVAGLDPKCQVHLLVSHEGVGCCEAISESIGSCQTVTAIGLPRISVFGEAARAVEFANAEVPSLILTSKGAHALALRTSSASVTALRRISLLFHWPPRSRIDKYLHLLAGGVKTHCVALATTSSIARSLSSLGWSRVREISYPVVPPRARDAPAVFSHVVMAGPLRANKGLATLVDLVALWTTRRDSIPLQLQVTPKHGTRHGTHEARLLRQLFRQQYPHLYTRPTASDRDEYLLQYRGAICLASYDPSLFATQISGVSMDAILSGAPVVVSKGTDIAHFVAEHDCGIVVPYRDVDAIDHAISSIRSRWTHYSENAYAAASTLAHKHAPTRFTKAWLDAAADA